MKKILLSFILGMFLGIFAEKIDLPLRLQMWGSFYVLPTKKHITINCYKGNSLFVTTNNNIKNSIDLACYEN